MAINKMKKESKGILIGDSLNKHYCIHTIEFGAHEKDSKT